MTQVFSGTTKFRIKVAAGEWSNWGMSDSNRMVTRNSVCFNPASNSSNLISLFPDPSVTLSTLRGSVPR